MFLLRDIMSMSHLKSVVFAGNLQLARIAELFLALRLHEVCVRVKQDFNLEQVEQITVSRFYYSLFTIPCCDVACDFPLK